MSHKEFTMRVLVIFLLAGAAGILHTASQGYPAPRFVSAEDENQPDNAPVRAPRVQAPGWQQVNSSGFGDPQAVEVSALGVFNGYLYAGTHNALDGARIFRSQDGVTWSPASEPGFGEPHDIRTPAILDLTVFKEEIYAGTGRGDGPGQIWRSVNGSTWAPMVIHGFGNPDTVDVTTFVEYGGMLYAGVTNLITGAQIWRSPTGDNNSWKQVAPAVPGTDPAWVTGMAELNGVLYAAIESQAPAQIWSSDGVDWTTVVSDGFGSSSTTLTGGMAQFAGSLYVGAGDEVEGALLFRTSDGTSWDPAISPGFGDPNNQKVEMVFVFQQQLYISVKNLQTGLELWRSADGADWEQVNQDGFGDQKNSNSNASSAVSGFLGDLYVGTVNDIDGGEVWCYQEQQPPTATPTATSPASTPGPTETSPGSTPVPTLSPSSSKLYFPVILPRR